MALSFCDVAKACEKSFQAFATSQRLARNHFKLLRHRNGLREIISSFYDIATACEKSFQAFATSQLLARNRFEMLQENYQPPN
jgi:hypothetical protein